MACNCVSSTEKISTQLTPNCMDLLEHMITLQVKCICDIARSWTYKWNFSSYISSN